MDEKMVWAKPFVVPSNAGVGEEHETKMNIAPVQERQPSPKSRYSYVLNAV